MRFAGTGFAIGRRVIDTYCDQDLLPKNSMTEDYKLSLTLRMQGFRVHYVLEKCLTSTAVAARKPAYGGAPLDGATENARVQPSPQPAAATRVLDETQVELSQAAMALAYALHQDRTVDDIAREMGLAASHRESTDANDAFDEIKKANPQETRVT